MGKINLDKAIEEGRGWAGQSPAYDLTFSEWKTLASRPQIDAVADAFSFGFLQGTKAERTRRKEQNGFT